MYTQALVRVVPSTRHFSVRRETVCMNRRALLGTLASLTVAGCAGTGPGSGENTTERTTTTEPTTAQPTTANPTTQSGTPPEIRDLGVPVDQADCPFESDSVERVVCYPQQTGDSLLVTPSTDTVELPTGAVTFTLTNDTSATYSVNFYDWTLHKRVDGQWFHVTPRIVPDPLHRVPSGESHEWTVHVDNTQEPTAGPSDTAGGTVAGLGGGEYAFEVSGWFEFDDHSFHVGLGAHVDLLGDQLELTPSADLSVDRDGETVVATRTDEDAEPTAAFVVERVGQAGVPPERPVEPHIAEELVRPYLGEDRLWLRDALALFADGVTTVRIRSAAEIDPPRFDRDQRYYLQFRGAIYEAKVVSLG
jgi:hypothetical protein